MSWPLLNILELHHPDDTEKSSVRAFGNSDLNNIFDELCREYVGKNKISYKELANEIFEVNPNSIQSWRGKNKQYVDGHPVPLWALKKILQLNNMEFSQKHIQVVKLIKFLQCGRVSEKTRAEIYLTPELARICGAHAADGCLNGLLNRAVSARWDLGDQEKQNILSAREWVQASFGFMPVLMEKGKMSYTWSNRQVISRYLTRIFDFPIGKKTQTVRMPQILTGNDQRILEKAHDKMDRLRSEFACEVVNFDGHSTYSGGVVQVGLGVNSKQLLEDVKNIFSESGIKFHIYDTKILTTSFAESKKLYSVGLFRGQKRIKFEKLILQHTRIAEKKP